MEEVDNTREEFAWAAGFFDGEANFYSETKKGYRRFIVQIAQKDRQVLDRLVSIFPFSKVSGPYEHRGKYRFPKKSVPTYYRWSVQKFEFAQRVVCCVWPWLSEVKRNQIKTALNLLREERESRLCNIHNQGTVQYDKRGNSFCPACKSQAVTSGWITRKGGK